MFWTTDSYQPGQGDDRKGNQQVLYSNRVGACLKENLIQYLLQEGRFGNENRKDYSNSGKMVAGGVQTPTRCFPSCSEDYTEGQVLTTGGMKCGVPRFQPSKT